MPRCRACSTTWTWSDELAPVLVRDRHACPACGVVTRRARWLYAGYCGVLVVALLQLEWRVAVTVLLAQLPALAVLEHLRKNADG